MPVESVRAPATDASAHPTRYRRRPLPRRHPRRPLQEDARPGLGDARATRRGWAWESRIAYGSETERGIEALCALERFIVGPADDPDFSTVGDGARRRP